MTTQDKRIALEVEKNLNEEYKGIYPVQLRYEQSPDGRIYFHFNVVPGVGQSIGGVCAKIASMDQKSLNRLMDEKGF